MHENEVKEKNTKLKVNNYKKLIRIQNIVFKY